MIAALSPSSLSRLSPLRPARPPGVVGSEPVLDRVELTHAETQESSNRSWLRAVALSALGWGLLSGAASAMVSVQASGLMETVGPGAPRPAEAAQLQQRLHRADPAILKLLERDGVRYSVVRPGTSFAALGALESRSLQDYQARVPEMRQQAERARQAAAPFRRGLDSLLRQRQAGRLDPGLEERISLMQRDMRQAALDALPAGSWIAPYAIPSLAGQLRDRDGLHELVRLQREPKGTVRMAELVGARGEQVGEYQRLLEAINGPELQAARQASLQQATPQQRQAWEKDPGQIPLDLKSFLILAPDLAYLPDGQGGSLRAPILDAGVQAAWANAQGKTVTQSPIRGQYFPNSRKVLVQSNRIAPSRGEPHAHTPVHEMGHALEAAVERHDPRFYQNWLGRVQGAFQRARSQSSVSEYATTNLAEYIAEGVGHYYEDPGLLKQKDPQLFRLTQELLEKAADLGRKLN